MRFSETRAKALAQYAIPALLKEQKKRNPNEVILWIRRSELATLLGMTNSRLDHAQFVADHTAKAGVIMAISNSWVYFFFDNDAVDFGATMDADGLTLAEEITDKFTKVFGSIAADEMLEEETYLPPKVTPKRKAG